MNEETSAGIILTCVLLIVLLFIAIIVSAFSGSSDIAIEGVTGLDLRLAVESCIPYDATFEQELACYQAIYGGSK